MTDKLQVLRDINKAHVGVAKLGSQCKTPDRIPTGSMTLDLALGGGFPTGRIVTLWGAKASTKSTLSLWTISNAQKMGKNCVYIDAEKTYDPIDRAAQEINNESLIVIPSAVLENIIDATEELFKNGLADVVVVDSVSQIYSMKALDEDDNSIGQQSRAVKKLLSKFNYWNEDSLIILISQVTVRFQGQNASLWFTGGNNLAHMSSVVINLNAPTRSDKERNVFEKIKVGDKTIPYVVAQDIKWRVDFSKVSLPYAEGSYRFMNSGKNDSRFELVELASKTGVVEVKGGGNYYYPSEENVEHHWRGRIHSLMP